MKRVKEFGHNRQNRRKNHVQFAIVKQRQKIRNTATHSAALALLKHLPSSAYIDRDRMGLR